MSITRDPPSLGRARRVDAPLTLARRWARDALEFRGEGTSLPPPLGHPRTPFSLMEPAQSRLL